MIRSFRDKETAAVWRGEGSRRLPRDIQDAGLRKLRHIEAAAALADLRIPPGNRPEALRGKRAGQYAIRINDRWRICFEWSNGGADNVEIADYR
jgi:proteic killer suppression protein